MSIEKAIEVFTRVGFKEPQWAVKIIQKAETLKQLGDNIVASGSSGDQFVCGRMSNLYKGDPDFKQRTLKRAKEHFQGYGVHEEIVDFYISNGGGIDIALAAGGKMSSGDFPETDHELMLAFFGDANEYMFETLRAYVVEPDSE